MRIEKEVLLSHLPVAEEVAANGIVLNGWLVPGAPGEVSILIGDYCLSFAQEDLLAVKPNTLGEQSGCSPSIVRASVAVRRGAPLLDVTWARSYDDLFSGCKPFALAVRPLTIRTNV